MARALAVAHIVIAILLAPATLALPILAPVLLAGPIWVIWLSLRLWKQQPGIIQTLRRTHFAFFVVDALLIWWGIEMLRAADKSATRGGGLLGGVGLLPAGLGIALAMFSVLTLALTRRR